MPHALKSAPDIRARVSQFASTLRAPRDPTVVPHCVGDADSIVHRHEVESPLLPQGSSLLPELCCLEPSSLNRPHVALVHWFMAGFEFCFCPLRRACRTMDDAGHAIASCRSAPMNLPRSVCDLQA